MAARRLFPIALATVVIFMLLGAARSLGPAKDIPAGTGYSAHDLCTRTMQSRQDYSLVRTRFVEPKVQPLPTIWKVGYEPGVRVQVESTLPTLANPRLAIFRAGLGCTMVPPGTTEAVVRAQPFRAVAALAPSDAPWPNGEASAQSELLSDAQRKLVEQHAARIFSEPDADPKHQRNVTALLVAQGGHLVYERYGFGMTRQQPQLGWSMTKTLTALIAGLLVTDHALQIDQPVGLPQWEGTAKASITWRQLLNMAPGLSWFEGYGGASDATEMLFSQPNQGAWAADRPLTSEPGTVFNYSTGFTNIAMLRIKQLLGGTHQAVYDYYQQRLFAPLGIRNGVIEPDASGTPVGGARGLLRPVDWLRLGQLVSNRGEWNGARIIAPEHMSFMSKASPASDEYGGFIWRRDTTRLAPELRQRLPGDLVFFAGHMGQFVVVVPSKDLVVLRMGVSLGPHQGTDPALTPVMALVADLL